MNLTLGFALLPIRDPKVVKKTRTKKRMYGVLILALRAKVQKGCAVYLLTQVHHEEGASMMVLMEITSFVLSSSRLGLT